MPFFAPTDDPGSNFPELLRRVGLNAPIDADGDIEVPHATTCVALTFAGERESQLVGLGPELDRLGLALGVEDGGFLAALGGEDGGGLLAVGSRDGGLLVALRLGDRRAPVALGAHLGVHRGDDLRRWVDALDLDPHDPDAPLVGGVVEHVAQLGVDRVA